MEVEYENFGDELIEKYHDVLSVGYDYTVKLYQDKFCLSDSEIRMLGDWTKVSSYYGGEPDFIISKPNCKVLNDVRSVMFYANRVCVVYFYWNTYVFGSWKVTDDKHLIINLKYMVETNTENKSIVNFVVLNNQSDIVLVDEVEFTDYYIFMKGFNFKSIPEELSKKFCVKQDVPRVKHSFYWPGENHFDPKYFGGKILYNFEWNEDSVKDLYKYFFSEDSYFK
ncbi:MAG: hypothetical protein IJ530_04305 [Treponema sp.]|uniref:hypothetical protein n=1 Tax=Treponema sp. TaxID=166 RepID=UPI0025FCF5DB|nr:hypothetical protein [Treponema sp.]MBQ8678967.1 hypothetical protein [Treponema sp.]